MNKQSGQTLIEVITAISIASVVLGGLVIVVLNGLRNAKFAQNQALATKYAQDTMEELRAIRDRNLQVNGTTTPFACYLGNCNGTTPSCIVNADQICYFSLSDTNLLLTDVSPSSTTTDSLGNGFSRTIKLSPLVPPIPNEKTFSVIVSWVDISGTHKSTLQTNLTNL